MTNNTNNAAAITTSFNAVSEDFRPPENWQWNLTISREVMKNTVVEASYIGNRALHLERLLDWNEVVPSARFAVAQAERANDPTVNQLINDNRRLPGLTSISMTESTGNSSYHALQIWANRRFSHRIALQAAYTWSHAITNVPLAAYGNGTTDPSTSISIAATQTSTAGTCLSPMQYLSYLRLRRGAPSRIKSWETGS
jgi:hypothetical protein